VIETRTVFVVGAGASHEAGLPIGSELTKAIARRLAINSNNGLDQRTTDRTIAQALHIITQGQTAVYIRAAQDIKAAMPLAPSIDNFLDAHKNNEEVIQLGKLAISASILHAERESSLYVDTSNSYNTIAFSKLEATWFVRLWHILSTGVETTNVDKIFSNVSFVVFNYDRCIEQFLSHALNVYFKIGFLRAQQIMGTLMIIHPYGKVGELYNPDGAVGFGEDLNHQKLVTVAKKIKTFTEQTNNNPEQEEVYSTIERADKIVFLGFAYHPINMKLLTSGRKSCAQKVYGTSLGMSDSDAAVVRERIKNLLEEGTGLSRLGQINLAGSASYIEPALLQGTCFQLFNDYSQSIGQ